MMMSTKRSLQSLTLVLVVFIIFTVSLTENLQIADGLSGLAYPINFKIDPGQTQSEEWVVINDNDEKGWVEFYADGPGSEFLTFNKIMEFEPRQNKPIEIIVSIPKDHPDNIELRPSFFALKRGDPLAEGVTGASVNIQLKKIISIKIGDNPIYTAPLEDLSPIIPDEIIIPEKIAQQEAKETLEEKMARIEAENNAILKAQLEEAGVDDQWEAPFEEEAVPELQVDDNYIPEPGMDAEPVAEINAVDDMNGEEGGCLIATATFGSELAPQVQLLREIRDNQLMGTSSGMAFMSGFNSLYYSFSPVIADMERENPTFKELVKITITPMISTLSVMEYAESESEVLGLGIGVILMNLGMYVGLPTFGIVKLIQFRKN